MVFRNKFYNFCYFLITVLITTMISGASNIMPGAEPIELKAASDQACLLVHGLSGGPSELREVALYLNDHNFNINTILLPGHGTDYHDMGSVTWQDWYKVVEDNYLEMKKKYKNVYVIGFSTGSTLSLHLARNYKLDKLVIISPFIFVKYEWYYIFPPEFYARTLGRLVPFVKAAPSHVNDPEGKKKLVNYDMFSLNAVNTALDLIEIVKNELPGISTDTLIIQSTGDQTVDPSSSEYIYQNLGSKNKKILWFTKSNHIIALDYDKEEAFKNIYDFLVN